MNIVRDEKCSGMVDLAPIFRNATLLLSIVFIYSLFMPALRRHASWVQDIVTGALFGAFTILTMNDPIRLAGGGIIDIRHVFVMAAAIIGGWRGGLVAAIISSWYRAHLGGYGIMPDVSSMGMIPGINSIITAYIIGVVYHHLMKGSLRFDWPVLIAGLLIPLAPLSWMLTMAGGIGWRNLPVVAPAVLVVYPVATCILMWLLWLTQSRIDLIDEVWQFEQRQDAIFEQMPTLLIGFRPDGTISNLNLAAEDFLKVKKETIVGRNRLDLSWGELSRQARLSFEAGFAKAVQGSRIQKTMIFKRDDSDITMDVMFVPILDKQQNVVMVLVEANDITHQLRLKEQELTIAFERERAGVLQQLIADASHHLRTPITIISSSLYLMDKHLQQVDATPEQREAIQRHVTKLENAQTDLNEIVSDLLSLMRLDNPQQHEFVQENLSRLLAEFCDNYIPVATDRELRLHQNIQKEPVLVEVATDSFRRIIENLIENALRYTPKGGTVLVTLERDARHAIFKVNDTGIGIPEQDLKQIFDRFYRASNAVNHNKKGTGLGLAIVKKTVELHQGDIAIESTPGEGTTVTVRIPLVNDLSALAVN